MAKLEPQRIAKRIAVVMGPGSALPPSLYELRRSLARDDGLNSPLRIWLPSHRRPREGGDLRGYGKAGPTPHRKTNSGGYGSRVGASAFALRATAIACPGRQKLNPPRQHRAKIRPRA